MISKSFEFKKININDYNYYLFYGENNGLKNEIIEIHFKTRFSANHYNYEEDVILKNKDNFFDEILTKSFFEEEKLIIISETTSKIIPVIEELIEKKIDDIFVILFQPSFSRYPTMADILFRLANHTPSDTKLDSKVHHQF